MAALKKDQSRLADSDNFPLIGEAQTLVADPAAITGATLTITYGTDDPSITTNNAIAIADGDGASDAEVIIAIEEIVAALVKTNADVLSVRTKLVAALDVLEEHGLMKAS
jgi:hypothetical protein